MKLCEIKEKMQGIRTKFQTDIKTNGRKHIKIIGIIVFLAVAGTAAGVGAMHTFAGKGEGGVENGKIDNDKMAPAELSSLLMEEGTTQLATEDMLPDFIVDAVKLYIEEVYVSVGDTVSAGDALYKITDESIQEAKAYYEDAIEEAETALETAQLNYEAGSAEAEVAKSSSELDASTAEDSLNAALLELDQSVEEKKEEWEDAKEQIETYTSKLDSNAYYSDAGIDEKTEAVNQAESDAAEKEQAYETARQAAESAKNDYETAKSSLQEAITNLNTLTENEDTSQWELGSVKSAVVAIGEKYDSVNNAKSLYEQKQTEADNAEQQLQQSSQTLQQAKQQLEQATEEYKKNEEDAQTKLEELEGSVDDLENAYEQAERDAEVKKVSLQKEYEEAVLGGNYADQVYNTSITELESAVTEAEETLEDLQEQQSALLALENGVILATEDGTIAAVTYSAGNVLKADTALVSFYDTDTIWISLEVSQENITDIAVGDTVEVSISGSMERQSIEGTVYSIASAATTGNGVSNVTYTVLVEVDNTDGAISSGQSVTVRWKTEKEEGEE